MSTYTALDLKLAADMAVPGLSKRVDPFNAFAKNFMKSGMKKLDTVVVQTNTAGAAVNFVSGSNDYGTAQSDTTVGKPIVLDNHVKSTMEIPGYLFGKVDLADKVRLAAQKVIGEVETRIYAGMTTAAGFSAEYLKAVANFNLAAMLELDVAASDANLGDDRVVVLSDAAFANLLVSTAGLYKDITYNPIVVSNLIKTTAVENTYGFITDKSAIGLVAAPVDITAARQDGAVAIEEMNIGGFPVTVRMIYDKTGDRMLVTAECLFGFAAIQPAALIRIVSA